MLASFEKAAVEQAFHVASAHVAVGDAAARRLHLDHRLEPQEPARSGAHDLDGRPTPCGFSRNGARNRIGAD